MTDPKEVKNESGRMYLRIRGKVLKHIVLYGGNNEPWLTSETYFSASNAKKEIKRLSKALGIPIK